MIADERVDSEGFFFCEGVGVSSAEDFRRLGRRGGWSAAGKLGWKRGGLDVDVVGRFYVGVNMEDGKGC